MRRYQLDQADWHVTLRGARRLLLFHEQEDYQTFYGMLGHAGQQSGMSHIANCLMSNHFHLSLHGSSSQLSKCMWYLDRQYSGYHNEKYGLSGHAFEQEYYREPIPSEFILKRVVRYIHLNPVRARMVQRPEDYPWSSYLRMTNPQSGLVDSELRFLRLFDEDLEQARNDYVAFVEKDLGRVVVRPPAKNSAWEVWQEHFYWFQEFAEESKEVLYPVPVDEVAAWWAVKSGVPPRVIGQILGHENGRQVSRICYRLGKMLEQNPSLAHRINSLGAL